MWGLAIYWGIAGIGCLSAVALAASVVSAQDRGGLCGSLDRAPADLARVLAPLGENGRQALVALLASDDRDLVLCGMAGLSAFGDTRAVPRMAAALTEPGFRDQAWRVARWAAYLAAGSDPGLAPAFEPVVDALDTAAARQAAGDDGFTLLGEIDLPAARDRLLTALDGPHAEATLDAIVHAIGRQGDARASARITAIGTDAERGKSGNATPEQARRLGAVAFYQLAQGPDTLAAGLRTLDTISARDRADAAAWAVHTLCARAIRRPSMRATIDAHRRVLVDELIQRGLDVSTPKGPVGCTPP